MTYNPSLPTKTHSAQLDWITPNCDDVIAYNARWSAQKNQGRMRDLLAVISDNSKHSVSDTEKSAAADELQRLTASLISNAMSQGHVSVLETATLSVHVKTTLRIAPHLLRHKSAGFQQYSLRYATLFDGIDLPEMRLVNSSGRKRDESELVGNEDEYRYLYLSLRKHLDKGLRIYLDLLNQGFHPECAANFLPVCTPTYLTMTAPIRTWYTCIPLRCHSTAQAETRKIFFDVLGLLEEFAPTVHRALVLDNPWLQS